MSPATATGNLDELELPEDRPTTPVPPELDDVWCQPRATPQELRRQRHARLAQIERESARLRALLSESGDDEWINQPEAST